MKSRKIGLFLLILTLLGQTAFGDSEVFNASSAKVIVREHPRTGKPFVALVDASAPGHDPFAGQRKLMKRPDYRMLDPKMKSGQIPYEGPTSDRKKVYFLAASLATIGTVGGTAIIAAAPAATGAGAAGGAGLYAGAGAGIAAGTLSGTIAASKSEPDRVNFSHVSESHAVTSEVNK